MSNSQFECCSEMLKLTERYTIKTNKEITSLAEALEAARGKVYKAAVYLVHEFRFGYWRGNNFDFADGKSFDEKYLLEMRLFNDEEEIYLQKKGTMLLMRITDDLTSASDENKIKTVDSTSILFGKHCDSSLPKGFKKLGEPSRESSRESSRKISFIIPAEEVAKKYSLTTRSYIVYDKTTGQAGYGWSRWVSINPVQEKGGE